MPSTRLDHGDKHLTVHSLTVLSGGINSPDIATIKTRIARADSVSTIIEGRVGGVENDIAVIAPRVADVEAAVSEKARVFYSQPTEAYSVGDLWIQDGILYRSTVEREAGAFQASDWAYCILPNLTVQLYSTNGWEFRPGTLSTTIMPYVFRNAIDIVDSIPTTAFEWVLDSGRPTYDAAWNAAHRGAYRTIVLTADDINISGGISLKLDWE